MNGWETAGYEYGQSKEFPPFKPSFGLIGTRKTRLLASNRLVEGTVSEVNGIDSRGSIGFAKPAPFNREAKEGIDSELRSASSAASKGLGICKSNKAWAEATRSA